MQCSLLQKNVKVYVLRQSTMNYFLNPVANLLSGCSGCHKGYGKKLSCTQAQPGQAITSAVSYFPSISCATSRPATQYITYVTSQTCGKIILGKGLEIKINCKLYIWIVKIVNPSCPCCCTNDEMGV